MVLSIVDGLKNEDRDIIKSGKKFQVLLLSRNTGNCLNNDISLLKHMCKPMSIPTSEGPVDGMNQGDRTQGGKRDHPQCILNMVDVL